MLVEEIKEKFPLHFSIWNNDIKKLEELLLEKKHDIELLDPRNRTPLMLAVVLSHPECVKLLLSHKCNTTTETSGWTVAQEAVASANFDILKMIISFRDLHRQKTRSIQVPELLEKLKNSPDFYVEMKWEFSSWIPLMSRVCPSDTYKVFKRGSNVRIDTTLIGFDNSSWQRGNRSYLFKGNGDEAHFIEVDHDAKEYSVEVMKDIDVELFENGIPPSKDSIQMRLQSPIVSNNIDIDKISFERNKSGWFAWKNEKNENVNGYECRVYNASNVEFITRTRTEHLSESSKIKSKSPLQHLLGMTEQDDSENPTSSQTPPSPVPPEINEPVAEAASSQQQDFTPPTIEEYFSDEDLGGRDVGKPKKLTTKVQRFKATLWLGDDFPIKLQEQILPILDLMSTLASPHVSKLKDFITMQLPSGFPVRVEIPLFHVLNAVITFGNVFALETPVHFVTNIQESDDRLSCVIDDECFELPMGYTNRGDFNRHGMGFDDEDELLRYAIRQSLIDSGTENDEVDIWEALKCQRPLTPNYSSDGFPMDEETQQLQRALQDSLMLSSCGGTSASTPTQDPIHDSFEDNLELAIRLSRAEKLKENELLMEESRMIEMAIKLSLEER